MVTQETKEQQQIYNIVRSFIYIILIIELFVNIPVGLENPIANFARQILENFIVFKYVAACKLMEIVCVLITCIGTKAKKSLNFNVKTMVIYPITCGSIMICLSMIFYEAKWSAIYGGIPVKLIIYAFFSIVGIMLIHLGLDAISKNFNNKIGKDRFNFENEAFEQSRELVSNEYSVNIPMIFYHNKKMNKGWINIINPFRGTIVLGIPGSGKSYGVIEPFIRQHSAKGFAMMVYDYKFPTLARNLFYQYCKNKHYNRLPENCGFHIINFTDVEFSNRINPIQRKYIPDLAGASETAATLLEALNKGSDKKGGSEAFFQNSAENFLASIIYFFINFHPTGWKNGKKLKRYISFEGQKLRLIIKNWSDYTAVDEKGNVVLDFNNNNGENVSTDKDGMFVELDNFSYIDVNGQLIIIERSWYEDENGDEVEPDTVTGEFSDMPHVLAFLTKPYSDVFDILMQDDKIMSLMAPFQSAWKNRAMDQLEGMVGTLRVNAARLVSPEAYWVFSGDDFDLKISDREKPSYLIIANDPEKEQVIGSLNALILNRLISKINSKGNTPVSLIIDELPTLYVHKIDRLIATARSNKVSVTLAFQELPQLEADYGKNGMQKILTTCGNIFMGAVRYKETLEWAQNDVFGKTKQVSNSVTINDSKVSTSISEKMDYLVPASKLTDLSTGWLAGQAARDFTPTSGSSLQSFEIEKSKEFKTTKYFCKTNFNGEKIKKEESFFRDLPKIYKFANDREKQILLDRNFKRINEEVENMISELLGKDS